jgi:hypothetical protein
MPDIFDRLVSQLKADGMPERMAYAVATKRLQKFGSLKPGTHELTEKGKLRSAMGAAGRAKDRAARREGGSPSDYIYDSRTNTARKK